MPIGRLFLALLYMEADFERFVEDNEDDLYLLGRLVAVFVIGPWLIYKGIAHKDITLMWVGAALIVWDGVKVFFQIKKRYSS